MHDYSFSVSPNFETEGWPHFRIEDRFSPLQITLLRF